MTGMSPAAILLALVAVVMLTVGAVVAIFFAGGPPDVVLGRAGIITAITGGVIAALTGVVIASRAQETANGAADKAGRVQQAVNGHADELEAAQARIAFLETRAAQAPPSSATTQEQSHGQ